MQDQVESIVPGKYLSAGLVSPPLPAPAAPEPLQPVVYPPPAPKRWRSRWPIALLIVLAIAAVVAVWTARRRQQAASTRGPSVPTVKVFTGPFQRSLRVNGTIGAKTFAAIIAPLLRGRERGGSSIPGQLTLIKLVAPGAFVRKADVIAEFDRQWEDEHLDDHRNRLTQAKSLVDKRRAELAIEAENQQQLLRVAAAEYEKARLELRAAEVRSEIEAEKLKLQAEETAARYKQLQAQMSLKRASMDADLRSLEIDVSQEQNHIDRHTHNLDRMTVRAPIAGVAVMQSIQRSGQIAQVQEGDQVYPGTYFMQIVDLSQMILNATVNQADGQGLMIGQRASIRLDAYPELAMEGRLISIGAMAASGGTGRRGSRESYVRGIPLRFSIEGRDPRLIPDLSASADIRFKTVDGTLQVARGAVMEENGKTYVMVRRNEGFERRELQVGPRNNTHAVVVAGLSDGDEVAESSRQ